MTSDVLNKLTWQDLQEIVDADSTLCFEAKLQAEWPNWAATAEDYYTELLRRLKEKQNESTR